jgi:8-oxo-dGTP pyrophosphatase MutT (NUDIX family)
MVAGSILPVALHNNKLYFLFGKENEFADTPGFSDFGGGVDNNETPYKTALREGGEELTGFLGDAAQLEALIHKNGGTYNITSGTYHMHIFFLNYDENLPKYYNQNHAFLWNRMNKRQLESTKLFEKEEIRWFSLADMKKHREEFREFYRDIVDILIKESRKIHQFISTRQKGTRKQSHKNNTKTRKYSGGR